MVIHWIPLLCGLFFGLIPPRLLITSECRYLRFEALWERIANPNKTKQRRRRWWKLPMVWIDPVRGYFVADQLCQAFRSSPTATGAQLALPLVFTFISLWIVLWVQTSGRQLYDETISPTGFLGGMMVAMLPLVVALSAIALGASTAVVMKRFAAGYLIAVLATAGIGFLFLKSSPWLAVYALLVGAPLFVSWIRRSSLVMPVRC